MGWQQFDDWAKQSGLTFDRLPVSSEERFADHAVGTAEASADSRRGARLPAAATGCVVHHRHPRHQPSKMCRCRCRWCQGERP